MNQEIKENLNQLALSRTTAFCYGCYMDAKGGVCARCGSDDLMRKLPGVGVEYGTDWVITHILETELSPIDSNELFEEHIRGCYPETTQVGFMIVDTAHAMKSLDPIAWNLARDEYIDSLESDEEIVSLDHGATYYRMSDILHLIE